MFSFCLNEHAEIKMFLILTLYFKNKLVNWKLEEYKKYFVNTKFS